MDNIKEILFTNPLFLQESPEVNEVSEFYLPYSVGFEVECEKATNFDINAFTSITDILDVNIDNWEQRFRIPAGLQGFKCLFKISQALCENSVFNEGSGIHYHVDFTECFDLITDEIIEEVKPFVLEELDTWNYKGNYNRRDVTRHRCWVRIHSYCKTLEYRIGEMTFDYDLLLKRIAHVSYISKIVKENAKLLTPLLDLIASRDAEDLVLAKYTDNITHVIQNRKIKIGG